MDDISPFVWRFGADDDTRPLNRALDGHLRAMSPLEQALGVHVDGMRVVRGMDGSVIVTRVDRSNFLGANLVARRYVEPIAAAVAPQLLLRMEGGWLAISEGASVVGTTAAQRAYVLGAGTATPGGGAEVLWGVASPSAVATCLGGGVPAPTWRVADRPALGPDGTYLSAAWASVPSAEVWGQISAWMGHCTGLAALWASAQVARGRDPRSQLPAAWAGLPGGALGVLRVPASEGVALGWWLVAATSAGVEGVRLIADGVGRCLPAWLETPPGGWSDEDYARVECWALGSARIELTAGGAPAVLTLLDGAGVAAAYPDGLPHWAWRWSWWPARYGSNWATGQRAVSVVSDGGSGSGSAWRVRSAVSRLAVIGWSGGVPILEASADGVETWTPGEGVARLMLPASPGHWVALAPPTGQAPSAGGGAVAAWYDSDGEEHVERYSGATAASGWSDSRPDYDAASTFCAAGSRSVRYAGGVQQYGPAWVTSAGGSASLVTYQTGTTTTYTLTAGSPVQTAVGWGTTTNADGSVTVTLGPTACSGGAQSSATFPDSAHVPLASRTPVGADTRVQSTTETWTATHTRILLVGESPGLVALLSSDELSVSGSSTVQRRLYDDDLSGLGWSESAALETVVGSATMRYPKSVPVAVSSGSSETTTVSTSGPRTVFSAAVRWGTETMEDSDSARWSWVNGGAIEGTLAASLGYLGEAILWAPSGPVLPAGLHLDAWPGAWAAP